jgi:hypothetical protein
MTPVVLCVLTLGLTADPSPPADRGYLTRAELDKVTFGPPARVVKEPGVRVKTGDAKLAVVFPKPAVEEGEPVAAYLVLRWWDDPPRDVPDRVELASPDRKAGQFARIHVHDAKTRKPVPVPGRRTERLEDLHRAFALPENGSYVLTVDVIDDLDLGPGEYEVFATYSGLCSAAANLTVTRAERARPRTHHRLELEPQFRLTEVYEMPAGPQAGGKPNFDWKAVEAQDVGDRHEAQMAFRLGLGGKFYPDVRRVPAADDRLRATAKWEEKGGRDRLTVTFTPVDPKGPQVLLPFRPRVAVLVEPAGDDQFKDRKLTERMARPKPDDADPPADHVAPKALTVELPKGWRANAGYPGKCRVSVVVSSADFDFEDRARKPVAGEWVGVLRTDPVVLMFPDD